MLVSVILLVALSLSSSRAVGGLVDAISLSVANGTLVRAGNPSVVACTIVGAVVGLTMGLAVGPSVRLADGLALGLADGAGLFVGLSDGA